jgi:hypothetical protein
MPTVADFANFSDESFDLRIGGDVDRTLEKNISSAPAGGEGALLTWNVRREGTGNVTYTVKVNDAQLPTYTVTLADWSAVQEVIRTPDIRSGRNTVEFRVTGGAGILSVGDVTLFYRKNV